MRLFGRRDDKPPPKKYAVLVEGENYLIRTDGVPQRLGFYTTRWVEAAEPKAALEAAAALIRRELDGVVLNDRDDTPRMRLDKMTEVASFQGQNVPGSGFTWFAEEDGAEEDEAESKSTSA